MQEIENKQITNSPKHLNQLAGGNSCSWRKPAAERFVTSLGPPTETQKLSGVYCIQTHEVMSQMKKKPTVPNEA